MLGSRTRPASYGRSNSWSDSIPTVQNTPGPNSVQILSEIPSTPPSKSDWATVTAWDNPETTRQQQSMFKRWQYYLYLIKKQTT